MTHHSFKAHPTVYGTKTESCQHQFPQPLLIAWLVQSSCSQTFGATKRRALQNTAKRKRKQNPLTEISPSAHVQPSLITSLSTEREAVTASNSCNSETSPHALPATKNQAARKSGMGLWGCGQREREDNGKSTTRRGPGGLRRRGRAQREAKRKKGRGTEHNEDRDMGRPIPTRGRCAGPGRPHRSPHGTRGPSQRGRGRRRPYFEGEVMDAGAGRARAEQQQQQQQPQHGPSAAGRHLCSSVSVPRAPLPGQASHVSGGGCVT